MASLGLLELSAISNLLGVLSWMPPLPPLLFLFCCQCLYHTLVGCFLFSSWLLHSSWKEESLFLLWHSGMSNTGCLICISSSSSLLWRKRLSTDSLKQSLLFVFLCFPQREWCWFNTIMSYETTVIMCRRQGGSFICYYKLAQLCFQPHRKLLVMAVGYMRVPEYQKLGPT